MNTQNRAAKPHSDFPALGGAGIPTALEILARFHALTPDLRAEFIAALRQHDHKELRTLAEPLERLARQIEGAA